MFPEECKRLVIDDGIQVIVMTTPFSEAIKKIIRSIPKGKVSTYGFIAAVAGNPKGARQVARILHSCSDKYDLPWHRVVNRRGMISLPRYGKYELQKQMLMDEGVRFDNNDTIDLNRYHWNG